MRVYLFTYDRPKMLADTLKHLSTFGIVPRVFNDGVDFPHRGKQKFWMSWREAFEDAKKSNDTFFLFMPDDFENIDIKAIRKLHDEFNGQPYVYNIINDGRHSSWGAFKKREPINGTEQVGFTDCGFFCNRAALELLNFHIDEVNPKRFENYPNISSGVGQQLTNRWARLKVKFYKPVKSLAYHGDHESKMNPEERKKNPLKSI